ncbi:MAG: hypothetical protein Q9226_000080 [Calogaya cf. arnoldii]
MELHKAFVGKQLNDISVPAAVVRAVVRRNCLQVLQACDALDGPPSRPIRPASAKFSDLVTRILDGGEDSVYIEFAGLYSHAGHSYGGSSASQAMDLLIQGIEALQKASAVIKNLRPKIAHQQLILSIGATRTATSVQNLTQLSQGPQAPDVKQTDALKDCIHQVKANHDKVELHAGVYSFLDMQQLATQASPSASKSSTGAALSFSDIAFTILTEVASVYGERATPEALIAAGCFALGREPCKSYPGWGIVSNWGIDLTATTGRSGWQVGRISQEHGILTHDPSITKGIAELSVGQKYAYSRVTRVWQELLSILILSLIRTCQQTDMMKFSKYGPDVEGGR